MKRLPIGIQTFSELVDPDENYVYVDKTREIRDLALSGKYFFLSRPRRFGKSVLISTLCELFGGNQGLFKGLYIEDKWNWDTRHPVIKISFGGGDFGSEKRFEESLFEVLSDNAEKLQVECGKTIKRPNSCFRQLIKEAWKKTGQKVVILIDEYDKPILDFITEKEQARLNRDKLKSFYGIIKEMDEYIRFVFITGVSKFSKLNLFSGLNNLRDITLNPTFSTLCGYTHREVGEAFGEYLEGVDLEKLREWYNGYNYFGEPLYNPFDILLFLAENKEYRPYWWSTGNPSFLIDLLKDQLRYLPDLENCIVDDFVLDAFDVDFIDIVALLWQTGYLTFDSKFERLGTIFYKLKVPNREIQISLNVLFLDYFTNLRKEHLGLRSTLYDALLKGDMKLIQENIQRLFDSIPYQNYANAIIQHYEGYYASVIYAYFASLGLPLAVEESSNKGRVDMTIILPQKVYVIEFKVDQPGRALNQIKAKGYHKKHLGNGRDVYLVGISFSSQERNIEEFDWELIES
ncbi:MAG TPA: hypothetical protein ENJ63_02475 [Dissulfuribacter thermophilus]|uniref:AAA-ATPase-like domain-containing protein n=1 Tax=Dissulfuribacter thermophilus TaxID=1156395 RepID=A0A7V2SVI8_9BACT|nr:hypothetical protein [Dissulfuribacter thermophilus]